MAGAGFQFSPGEFKVKDADPEQTLERFELYLDAMVKAFRLNRRVNPTTGEKVEFDNQDKKDIIQLEGGLDMVDLFKHVGKVQDNDSYDEAMQKIRVALRGRGNRTAAVFKLFTGMAQGERTFDGWHKKVYEAAKQIDWEGYGADKAAVDALVMQTKSAKLQQKAIQDNPTYEELVKIGISQEQAKKKADKLPDGEKETTRALQTEVRRLTAKLSKVGEKHKEEEGTKCKKCVLSRCDGGERCPAATRKCNRCGELGHFGKSTLCKGKNKEKGVRKVQEEESSEEEVGRVEVEIVAGVAKDGDRDNRIRVKIVARQKEGLREKELKLLADTGVRRTILNLGDWEKLGGGGLKETKLKFRPYGTSQYLPIMGRAVVNFRAEAGAVIETEVYVNKDRKEESLLGEKDAERLGVITVRPRGAASEVEIRRIKQNSKKGLEKEDQAVMNNQKTVDERMEKVAKEYEEVFEGIGKYKGPPVKIQVEEGVRPVVQPPRRIPLHYQEPLREHIQELLEAGVIEGPLQQEEEGTWVSNLVITGKKWDTEEKRKGDRVQIRANLDCRPLNKVVYQTHEPIPTPEELRHTLRGSERFSTLDMRHCFHQFEIEEKARKLFTFRTSWGLFRYTRMVMGNSPASSECHRRVRTVLQGCEGVAQIKDDVLVFGTEDQHEGRLKAVLERFREAGLTLRRNKCKLGQTEVMWFGNLYSRLGMRADPAKAQVIKEWPSPRTVKEVKSLLQTLQYNAVYMAAEDGEKSYVELTAPLRHLTKQQVKFKWTEEMEKNFQEIKVRLCGDRVMVPYDPAKETKVFSDSGPEGTQATVAQHHHHPEKGVTWRPVHHTARAWTTVEKGYSQIEKESLGLYSGIVSNRMYLLGTKFTAVVDHKPLLPLFNKVSRPKQARVDRHRMKLAAFDFEVEYEPGTSNPCDYGSRHPPVRREGQDEEARLGQGEEDDTEVYVNRLIEDQLPQAITRKLLRRETAKDETLLKLMEDIKIGRCRPALHRYQQVFEELAIVDGLVVRGEQLIIPQNLKLEVVQLAHEGHQGQDKTLQWMRQSVWFPSMGSMVREFVESCLPCQAAQARTETEPLKPTEFPAGPWQELHADYKGPIGKDYYLHVLIDQYSKFPVVQVVKSTSWEQLKPGLEEALATHGIPEKITTDGGPPYSGHEFGKYCQRMGVEHHTTTPEDAQANGFAEAFVKIMVKLVHTALVEKRDPKKMVSSYLMAYRATPHKVTGRSPAEMLYNRKIRTKLPGLRVQQKGEMDREVRKKHKEERERQKAYADEKRRAKPKEVKQGDQVMIQQKKTTTKTPWDPRPYTVTEVKGSQVIVERGEKTYRRAVNLIKKIKFRKEEEKKETKIKEKDEPEIETSIEDIRRRIREEKEAARGGTQENSLLEESTDSEFTITYESAPGSPNQGTEQDIGEQGQEAEEQEQGAVVEKPKRLSPKQRHRRQSLARNKKKVWGEEWMVRL